MGHMEKSVADRKRKGNIQKIILSTIKISGALSVGLLAPNALQLFKLFNSRGRSKSIINRGRERLIRAGLLQKDSRGFLILSPKGESKLRELELADYRYKHPKRWDKKWRVLIFDIEERRKPLRDKVRRTLMQIGFSRLQDSVWVYPYDCEDLIALLKTDFKVGKDLLYLVVEEMEGDKHLRQTFGLQ